MALSPEMQHQQDIRQRQQQTGQMASAVGNMIAPGLGGVVGAAAGALSGLTQNADGSHKSKAARMIDPLAGMQDSANFLKTGNVNDLTSALTMGLAGGQTTAEKRIELAGKKQMDFTINNGRQQSASLYGGIKKMGNSLYEEGGKLEEEGPEQGPKDERATILNGKTHALGGNAVTDEAGEKIAETETEELLLNAEQTKIIEQLTSRIGNAPKPEDFLSLGKYIKQVLTVETQDLSGKYGTLSR